MALPYVNESQHSLGFALNRPPSATTGSTILGRLEAFLRVEAASGVLLVAAAAAALLWANSPWAGSYEAFWNSAVHHDAGASFPAHTLRFWINDGLMSLFFLVVGLEIRREIHEGALSNWRSAALPLLAALGGVIVPALIYLGVVMDPALRRGWAVPTATDIAFSLGVLAFLGRRVPPALRALLVALAMIDDLIAMLVIAFFYSSGTLHPTLIGALVGFLLPVSGPTRRIEHALHPWVAYAVMPLFALANAGVDLGGAATARDLTAPVGFGIVLGLVLGKPLGIFLAARASVAIGVAALPDGIAWRHILLLGTLGGVGFTMSLFISQLAFPEQRWLAGAKIAVLLASVLAAVLSLILGRAIGVNRPA